MTVSRFDEFTTRAVQMVNTKNKMRRQLLIIVDIEFDWNNQRCYFIYISFDFNATHKRIE